MLDLSPIFHFPYLVGINNIIYLILFTDIMKFCTNPLDVQVHSWYHSHKRYYHLFIYLNLLLFIIQQAFICKIVFILLCSLEHRNNSSIYGMYDVYNNAFSHGGRTTIVFDRYFIVESNGRSYFTSSALQKSTKYANRNTMSDTTMRIAVVVSHFLMDNLKYFSHFELIFSSLIMIDFIMMMT